ncbi:hypothetical protein J4Q44_G00300650 [Coregonus suidteri]|uniref:Uncharacterized protein n=1 Tax=Coregonus suidteri TaxID=861788 RepID=A0AAN8KWB5_9TELE
MIITCRASTQKDILPLYSMFKDSFTEYKEAVRSSTLLISPYSLKQLLTLITACQVKQSTSMHSFQGSPLIQIQL